MPPYNRIQGIMFTGHLSVYQFVHLWTKLHPNKPCTSSSKLSWVNLSGTENSKVPIYKFKITTWSKKGENSLRFRMFYQSDAHSSRVFGWAMQVKLQTQASHWCFSITFHLFTLKIELLMQPDATWGGYNFNHTSPYNTLHCNFSSAKFIKLPHDPETSQT